MSVQLGGYTLLHIAMDNIGPHSPSVVQLLLQYGADPNSGRKLLDKEGDSSVCYEEEEEVEEEEEGIRSSTPDITQLMAGEHEGSDDVTPLHVLCTQTPNTEVSLCSICSS